MTKVPVRPPIDDTQLGYRFPVMHHSTLDNGMALTCIQRRDIPKIYFRMGFKLGDRHIDPALSGLTDLLARVLKKGTLDRSREEIASAVDFRGGYIGALSGADALYVFGEFLTEFAEFGFELLSEIVRRPLFDESILAKEKERMIADLQNERSSPAYLGQMQIVRALYTPHPYSYQKNEETVAAVTRDHLIDLHQRRCRPADATLVIGGDIEPQEAERLSERYFGKWQGDPDTREAEPLPPNAPQRRIYLIHRPGAQQVNLMLGNPLFERTHADYEAMVLTNKILGGGGSGRLFLKLREEKGYTYGAYSSLDVHREYGAWYAQADTRPEVVSAALSLFFEEFEKMRSTPVAKDELDSARRYVVGVFPLRNEAPSSIANLALWQRLYGFPDSYWEEHLRRLEAISVADVQRASDTYIRPDNMSIVAVGDAGNLAAELGAFGEVEILNERLEAEK